MLVAAAAAVAIPLIMKVKCEDVRSGLMKSPGAGVVGEVQSEACSGRARGANALAGCKADDQRGKWVRVPSKV
jgi:hypothetical protein